MKKLKYYLLCISLCFGLSPMLISIQAYSQSQTDSTHTYMTHSINDKDIARAVKTELLIAPNISPDSINVNVSNGVVTLSGETDNILTKRRASKIAGAVTGVISVVNDIKVRKALRSDAKIKDDILTALANNPATDAFEVNTEVNNGNVTLSGTVQSWQEKELCRRVAESVKGVRDVTNNIKINYTAFRSDQDIKADILSRLKWDIYVNQQFINVSVNNGNVDLAGTVASAAEKEWAYNDAWVNGVKNVNDNDLKIQWWENTTPAGNQKNRILREKEIQAALEQAFILDPKIISDRINIRVDNGTVTLKGTVSNLQAKNAAEHDALRTIGVLRVKNDLNVKREPVPDDSEIENRVYSVLSENPYLVNFKPGVSVQNGKVFLTGQVDNKFEKNIAGEAASSVKGVAGVQNDITYEAPQAEVKNDTEIKDNIKKQLYWDPITNAQNINIEVKDGRAVLTGFVATQLEKSTATIEAYQGGAAVVDNELGVTSGPVLVNE